MLGVGRNPGRHSTTAGVGWPSILLVAVLALVLVGGAAFAGWWSDRGNETVAADVAGAGAPVSPTPPSVSGSSGGPAATEAPGGTAEQRTPARGSEPNRQQPAGEQRPTTAKKAKLRAATLVMEVVPGAEVTAYSEDEWQKILDERAAARLAKAAEATGNAGSTAPAALDPGGQAVFKLASFNVLGSNHTCHGCPRNPPYPTASVRTPKAGAKFREHGVAVVGLQELKPDQLGGLKANTGFAAWHGADTDNAIMWNPGVFEFVSGSTFHTRFMSRDRPQTVLRLRHRSTGREMFFVNMHASAGGGQYAGFRKNNHFDLVNQVNALKSHGLPIFVTGDMNDREAFYCRVVPNTGLVAAVGGGPGCSPPGSMPVDWVLGWGGVSFSGFWNDKSTLGRISDHHFVSARATIAAR